MHGPRAARAQQNDEKIDNTSWNFFLVDFGHRFVTILEFWRFLEVSMVPIGSSRRDLQSGNGPGALGAQQIMKI